MAIQPRAPQQRDRLGKILTLGGALAGGIAGAGGGVLAATKGAAMGAGLGQTAGGLLAKGQPTAPVESQGMQRRMQTLDSDPMGQIRQAQQALATLPPQQLPQTRQALQQAMVLAQRNQQLRG